MQVAIWKVAKSGTRVSLVLFILQEVGRLVSFHPSAVDYLEGRVSTGVVHAAQWSVPAGGQGDLRPGIMVDGSCDAVQSQIQEEKKKGPKGSVYPRWGSPFVIENTVGHVQRSQEWPDVVIGPVLWSVRRRQIRFLFTAGIDSIPRKKCKKTKQKTCWCECAHTNLYWTKQQTLIWDSSICPSYNSVTTLQMNLEPSPTIITNQYLGAGKYKDSASSFFFLLNISFCSDFVYTFLGTFFHLIFNS